jgi:hypothetical protein
LPVTSLAEDPGEVARLLLDDRRAVLGVVDRLVYLRAAGVQWGPCDHLCVVGEVRRREGSAEDWRLSGELWSLGVR